MCNKNCKECGKVYVDANKNNKRLVCPDCHNAKRRAKHKEKQREAGVVPRQVYGLMDCKLCGNEFLKEEGYHRKECPDCTAKRRAAYYDNNREMFLAKNVERAEHRKDLHRWLIAYKIKHPCVDCGESRTPTLQFDHIDRTAKTMEVSKMVSQARPLDMVVREVAKCEVRCVNCHLIKTIDEMGHHEGIDFSPR